jgi:hypothetical protein
MERKKLEKQLEVITKEGLIQIKGGVAKECPEGFTDCEQMWADTYEDDKYIGKDEYWSCGDEASLACHSSSAL